MVKRRFMPGQTARTDSSTFKAGDPLACDRLDGRYHQDVERVEIKVMRHFDRGGASVARRREPGHADMLRLNAAAGLAPFAQQKQQGR